MGTWRQGERTKRGRTRAREDTIRGRRRPETRGQNPKVQPNHYERVVTTLKAGPEAPDVRMQREAASHPGPAPKLRPGALGVAPPHT